MKWSSIKLWDSNVPINHLVYFAIAVAFGITLAAVSLNVSGVTDGSNENKKTTVYGNYGNITKECIEGYYWYVSSTHFEQVFMQVARIGPVPVKCK